MSFVEARDMQIEGRLHPVDLQLHAGSLTALVGPNGSGKTSLLHALAQIGSAKGVVNVGGERLGRQGPARKASLLSFLPASRHLPWPIRSRDLIALSGAEEDAIDALIERLELADVAGRRADLLSTGERSRVLIARALAPAPRLLLLDEPTSNLDPLWQIRMMELLRDELTGTGRAVLVAMHDLDAAATYADRLIVMDGGRIVGDGPPHEVLASSTIARVFGIERVEGSWRVVRTPADPLSSR